MMFSSPNKENEARLDEHSERLSNDKQLDLTQSKHFFENDRIKSSRRYHQIGDGNDDGDQLDFDQLKGLSHRDD